MKKTITQQGFTIVETLVALSIFSVAVIALISVTISGSSGATYVKNKLTASYLAQEGIEMVRNLRDTASFIDPQNTWNLFFGTPTGFGVATSGVIGDCVIPVGVTITPTSPPAGCSIETNTDPSATHPQYAVDVYPCLGSVGKCHLVDNGLFFQYALIPSNDDGFTRYITIQEVDNSAIATFLPGGSTPEDVRELLVTSYVFWTKGGVSAGSVQFTERLFDWTTNFN
jgi:prepilin-type N-terminal cleavage/methylation domain-containing protein